MNNYTHRPDEQLIENFSLGDNAAFEALLLRHKDKVYTYIYNLTHETALADDIFQDTFIKAIDTIKAGRYNSQGRFLAWIIRIAHNNVMDHYRRSATDKTISNGDDNDNIFNKIDPCDNSRLETIEREKSLRHIERLITLLPPDQQRIIILRYYRNLSFKQIATLEAIPLNTALGRMRYALINLRKHITAQHLSLTL